MADSVIKYVTINNVLYRIEEYTYRGYAGSTHTGNTMKMVPPDEVAEVKKMLEEQEKNYEVRSRGSEC